MTKDSKIVKIEELFELAKKDKSFAEKLLYAYKVAMGFAEDAEGSKEKDDVGPYSDKIKGKALYSDVLLDLAKKMCEQTDITSFNDIYEKYNQSKKERDLNIFCFAEILSVYRKQGRGKNTDFFAREKRISTEVNLEYLASVVGGYRQGLEEEIEVFGSFLERNSEDGLY